MLRPLILGVAAVGPPPLSEGMLWDFVVVVRVGVDPLGHLGGGFYHDPIPAPQGPLNELRLKLPGQRLAAGHLPVQGGADDPLGPGQILGQRLDLTKPLGPEQDQLLHMGQFHKCGAHQDHLPIHLVQRQRLDDGALPGNGNRADHALGAAGDGDIPALLKEDPHIVKVLHKELSVEPGVELRRTLLHFAGPLHLGLFGTE